jgi:hypothetical protein
MLGVVHTARCLLQHSLAMTLVILCSCQGEGSAAGEGYGSLCSGHSICYLLGACSHGSLMDIIAGFTRAGRESSWASETLQRPRQHDIRLEGDQTWPPEAGRSMPGGGLIDLSCRILYTRSPEDSPYHREITKCPLNGPPCIASHHLSKAQPHAPRDELRTSAGRPQHMLSGLILLPLNGFVACNLVPALNTATCR